VCQCTLLMFFNKQYMEFVVTFWQLKLSLLYMKIHFVCHRQHYVLPLQRPISEYCRTRIIIAKCEIYMQHLSKYTVWAKCRVVSIKPSSTHSLSMKYLWAATVTTGRKGNGRKKLSFLCLCTASAPQLCILILTILVCTLMFCFCYMYDKVIRPHSKTNFTAHRSFAPALSNLHHSSLIFILAGHRWWWKRAECCCVPHDICFG